jgi:GT2 family glycosyltransferase
VPFGAFPRETFEKYGFFDERLARNEDNEINYRIRKNGGKVFLSSDIKFIYYCRDTLGGILNMAFQNGKWTIIASRLCPGSMGIRHLIPLVFVLSLIILATLSFISVGFAYLLLFELALFCLCLFFSIKVKQQNGEKVIIAVPLFHISYGCGSLCGLVKHF